MRKIINYAEAQSLIKQGLLHLSEYELSELIKVLNLTVKLNELGLDADTYVVADYEEDKYYFSHAKILMPVSYSNPKQLGGEITFYVEVKKSEYPEPHIVFSLDDNFAELSRSDKEKIYNTLIPPKKVGVLTVKKVMGWLSYLAELHQRFSALQSENRNLLDKFLSDIKPYDPKFYFNNYDPFKDGVQYSRELRGYIRKNGIKLDFTYSNGYINRVIILDIHRNDLATFDALADNKYNKKILIIKVTLIILKNNNIKAKQCKLIG